jgi:predicted house-cleaning noncanonical NTP pyrophosphatase (MazG superfamily)
MNSRHRKRPKTARVKSQLQPIQPVNVVVPEGLISLVPQDVTPGQLGHKAFGLASLPSGWTQPFFVVDGRCDFSSDNLPGGRGLRSHLHQAAEQLHITPEALVIVRSSGATETLSERGSHESATCRPDQLFGTLRSLKDQVVRTSAVPINWVVQVKSDSKDQGHLSNERRLREESRDWIVELESRDPSTLDSRIDHLSVRKWRDGELVQSDRLACRQRSDLASVLKQVAQWGMQFSHRLHFEWVWDGAYIYVVQADVEEASVGVDPRTLVPRSLERTAVGRLQVFRRAAAVDYKIFGKLKNAALYRRLGYKMPAFYVLSDKAALRSILDGRPTDALLRDLKRLTARPLIARVDGTKVPEGKREMLPRSDELRSQEAAVAWLVGDFARMIKETGLVNAGLCVIAHHFVPAVASAWARAEPNDRWVRIEALWGVPEGLYWYSHDTFETDTISANPAQALRPKDFQIRERRRFKGIFVAPNLNGRWITQKTLPPFDWRRSITRDAWLREIAATTRGIAIKEGAPTSVMWLVDVHPHSSEHQVLPWYHNRSDYPTEIRAAPRRKISSHRDFTVRDHADWDRLKALASEGRIDRVTVEPIDADLIRNPAFSESIIELAQTHGFVVELAGGLLSHIYYVLTRAGCKVECVDLYGADEDTVLFNKVVRDQIPGQIQRGGERAEVVRLSGYALTVALKRKLVEEALEVLDAQKSGDIAGELADVLEVLWAIARQLGITVAAIDSERARKNQKRGSFERGLMLVRTSTPHSLNVTKLHLEEDLGPYLGNPETAATVSSPVPASPRLAVKPDLRSVGRSLEKLISFSAEIPLLESLEGTTLFRLPSESSAEGPEVMLEIELRRSKSELRGAIRIRRPPSQFTFEFESPKETKW